MKEFCLVINSAIAIIGTILVWVFGEWDLSILTLIIFMILDCITGIIKAYMQKKIDSSLCKILVLKKLTILSVLVLAAALDRLINQEKIFRNMVCFWYMGNEGLSILNNISGIGVPIPEKLKEFIYQLKDIIQKNNKL